MTEIWTRTIRHAPPPPDPDSGVVHGVCLGAAGGVIATAELTDGIPTVTSLRRYPAALGSIASAVRELLADDPGCQVVLDRGLRGRELADQIGEVRPRRRLALFDAKAEDRRYEIGGRLSQALAAKNVKIKRLMFEGAALRRVFSLATREDAGDFPELVALSLAVVNRRASPPQIV